MLKSFNWHHEAKMAWDQRAMFWNENSVNMWDNGSRKDIVPFIEKHFIKEADVLDVGCGDGYGTYKLSQSGYQVTGMDLSSEMIHLAKQRQDSAGISFLQGDVDDLPFTDHSYDGVVSINVLEWTKTPAKGLQELHRVLKKDGLLCVGILGPTAGPRGNSYPRLYGEQAICNTMMAWEFQKLALACNLAYIDGFGVYKEGVTEQNYQDLPLELQQALTFMWVFMLRKDG